MVVLPTPPLPVTKSRRRSRSSVMSGPSASDPGELSAEPDATIVGRGADLDVGQLGRRHAHLPTLAVGEPERRSEEHTSELQSLMRISYAVFCLKKKNYTACIITNDIKT